MILCGTVTAICAVVEGMPLGIDDNLVVPLLAGGLLFAFSLVDPLVLVEGRGGFLVNFLVGLAVNGLGQVFVADALLGQVLVFDRDTLQGVKAIVGVPGRR